MSSKQEQLEALKLAVKTEEEGKAFYNKAAREAKTTLARETMESLARDEDFHILAIRKFYEELDRNNRWEDIEKVFTAEQMKGTDIKAIFSKALENAKNEMADFASDIEVYERAIKFEEGGADLYKRLRDEATDPMAKKFYDFLYEMEKEHTEVLENSLIYLKDPNLFFQDQESWGLEG